MFKQCTVLVATKNFTFRPTYNGKPAKGRAVSVASGARFWVASSELSNRSGRIEICREGRSTRYTFSAEQINLCFRVMRPLEKHESYAVIIRAIHERGQNQQDALTELGHRGLWLSPEQLRQTGLAS